MQLIAVAINFKDVAKRVFHVNHAIGFFTRIVKAWLVHTAFTAGTNNLLRQLLNIGILYGKVKHTGFPVFKIVIRVFLLFKLK